MFPLRNFPDCHHAPNPHSANLFLGYKVSLVHAVFGIDPSSILRSPFPHCNSSWIKIGFFFFLLILLLSSSGFFLTVIKALASMGSCVIRRLLKKLLPNITFDGWAHFAQTGLTILLPYQHTLSSIHTTTPCSPTVSPQGLISGHESSKWAIPWAS